MTDSTQLPPEPADESTEDDDSFERKQGMLDRFRGSGVGVEDPNLVGDDAEADVPPGEDPQTPPNG